MTTPDVRRHLITTAEQTLGSTLPDQLRTALIEDGQVAIDVPHHPDLTMQLCEQGQGALIFEDAGGGPLTKMGGWDDSAENWALSEGAFIVGFNGCGDYYLLSPDADGIARQLVFADHEVGELIVLLPDVENPRRRPPAQARFHVEAPEENVDDAQEYEQPSRLQTQNTSEPAAPDLPEQSYKPAFVFALSAAGIANLITLVIGLGLAYYWRKTDPANSVHYRLQIKLFWGAVCGWVVAAALFAGALVFRALEMDASAILAFKGAVLMGFTTQLLFTVASLYHAVKLSWGYVLTRASA